MRTRFAVLWDQLGRAQRCCEGGPIYELRSAPASVLSGLDVCRGVIDEQDGRATCPTWVVARGQLGPATIAIVSCIAWL
jgi:hypothetical protein